MKDQYLIDKKIAEEMNKRSGYIKFVIEGYVPGLINKNLAHGLDVWLKGGKSGKR